MSGQNVVEPKFPSGFAFIVGVGGNKDDADDYVNATARDAETLKKILEDPNMAGYDPDHIICLTYEQATKTNIEAKINDFVTLVCDRENYEDSTVILYFSGHGVRIRDNYYFVPHNNTGQSLNAFANEAANLISFPQLTELFELLRPVRRQITFFDCCHSGGANALGVTTPSREVINELKDGMATSVITSCRGDQLSYVKQDNSHTIFGECLFEALYGKGQPLLTNVVRLGSLSDYLCDSVPDKTKKEYPAVNNIPIPTRVESGVGNVGICRINRGTKLANKLEPIVPSVIGSTAVKALGIEVSPFPDKKYGDGLTNWLSLFLCIFLLAASVIGGVIYINYYKEKIELKQKYATNATRTCGWVAEAKTPIKLSINRIIYTGIGSNATSYNSDKDEIFSPMIFVFDGQDNVIEVVCPDIPIVFDQKQAKTKPNLVFEIKSGQEAINKLWITHTPAYKAKDYAQKDIQSFGSFDFLRVGNKKMDRDDLTDIYANSPTSENSSLNRSIEISKLLNDSETPYYFLEYSFRLQKGQLEKEKEEELKKHVAEFFGEHSPEISNLYKDIILRVYFQENNQIGANLNESETKKLLDSYKKVISSQDFPLPIRKDALTAFKSAPVNDEYNKTKDDIITTLETRTKIASDWEKPFLDDAIKQLREKE